MLRPNITGYGNSVKSFKIKHRQDCFNFACLVSNFEKIDWQVMDKKFGAVSFIIFKKCQKRRY
ncbi:MAG: hypothetical protein B6245_02135 [Desulfobacteraceae bacterium 4572_88]|nr:MAG: hypothetical protein B6245_02135 [Desulfobacteraceae bacterium 4572_88]